MRFLPPDLVSCEPQRKALVLSVKQRVLLHRLLHRELRKCSMSALTFGQRCGWTLGAGAGYELTIQGRRVAEISEQTPADRQLVLDAPLSTCGA
jgi:hypothetical protein